MANRSYNCSVENCHSPALARHLCNRHYLRWKKFGDPLLGKDKAANGAPLAFVQEALNSEGDECILWPFARKSEGQGCLWVDGRIRVASQYVCEVAHGPAPSDVHQAAHSCGKGHLGCVNKQHLSWKTPKENAADRIIHGTDIRGEKSPLAKLTEKQVLEIRQRTGEDTIRQLAFEYGVNQATIWEIQKRKIWAHI
jgi:hypothetical protein